MTTLQQVSGERARVYWIALGFALLGFVITIWLTPHGPDVWADSVSYLDAASNLTAGNGLTLSFDNGELAFAYERTLPIPLTIFAPAYSVLLAVPGFLGMAPLDAARLVNGLCFAALIVVAVLALARVTQGALWPVLLGALLILTAKIMLLTSTRALSEVLFIPLTHAGLLLLALWIDAPENRLPWISAIVIALALLTRYAGAAVMLAALVTIALSQKSLRARLRGGVVLVLVSGLPMALWLFRNWTLTGKLSPRTFILNPDPLAPVANTAGSLSTWVLPDTISQTRWGIVLGAGIVLVMLIGLVGLDLWRWTAAAQERSSLQRIWRYVRQLPGFILAQVVFISVYGVFVMFSAWFMDAHIPMDPRIFSPIQVSFLLVVVYYACRALTNSHLARLVRVVVLILLVVLAASYLVRAVAWATVRSTEASDGYWQWTDSDLLAAVAALPEDTPLYSNGPDIVYFVTGRPVRYIPLQVNPLTARSNGAYEDELALMRDDLQQGDGAVVYLNALAELRWFLPAPDEVAASLGSFRVLVQSDEGTLYTAAGGQ
ncbi:MAG: hypothetical protein JW910_04515 [Anaerolineae bacterium]|nr:hypothetical protein [Anaerolineae bacterium]